MHDTVAPLQVGVNVVSTLGVSGAVLAAGDLLGRKWRSARSRRSSARTEPVSGDRHPIETVTDNLAEQRFEIRIDGDLAGITQYERNGGMVTFNHTEIDPSLRGRGLAGTLVAFALDASRMAGLTIHPQCPYVAAFIDKHSEYNDLLASSRNMTEETGGCCALPS